MRRFVLYAMGAVVVFGVAVWSATGVAHACDPATGIGCDTPPATAAPAPQAPAAPQQPRTPSGGGEPFIPPGAQGTPTPSTVAAPPSTAAPAPVVPETAAEPASSTSDSGGGGVPWKWALVIPVVAAAGVGVAAATRKKPTMDPLAEYNQACGEMCWMKQVEAQADADAAAAQATLNQIDDAWHKARDYLRNNLREDYIFQKKWRAFGTLGNVILGGPFMWAGAVGFYSTTGPATHRHLMGTPRDWSDDVNQELLTGYGEIDRIHSANSEPLRQQLADATKRADDAVNGRHAAETKLVVLKAQNTEMTFPECECG